MDIVTIFVPGKAQAKQRPRVCRNGFSYTPGETLNYEKYVKWLYSEKSKVFFDCAVKLDVYVFLAPPKSVSRKVYQQMIAGVIKPTKKPDWDNLGKSISDSLNLISYKDDSCVTCGKVMKRYEEKECLVFKLQEDFEEVPVDILSLIKNVA